MSGRCVLDAVDPLSISEDDVKGFYFGALPNSRLEYETIPVSLRLRSEISMNFKTTSPDGVILYVSDSRHIDHMSISMMDGMIRYSFNCGTGSGVLKTNNIFNDGEWHKLVISRSFREASMLVDMDKSGPTMSVGRARSINVKPLYYFGGIETSNLPSAVYTNLAGITTGFIGCIADIKLNNKDIGEAHLMNGIQPCSDLTENGAYFYGDGGYIRLVESRTVDLHIGIVVELRPRSIDGIIFYMHGDAGHFVILEMVKGEMWFSVDNGSGAVTSKYIPIMNYTLCDGKWHMINAKKNSDIVTLTVDGSEPIVTIAGSATAIGTNKPIYLGGKPKDVTQGARAKGDYRGCMRNLYIDGERQYLATGLGVNDVSIQACPIN